MSRDPDDLCRRYIRNQIRLMTPPVGYRLVMYTLKETSGEMTAGKCGRYGIGLMPAKKLRRDLAERVRTKKRGR